MKLRKQWIALLLVFCFIFSWIPVQPAYAEAPYNYVEDFNQAQLPSGSYGSGTFTGNHGFTWAYTAARDQGEYGIDGAGVMLRRASDQSRIVATNLPGGIDSFAVDLKKGFTGSGDRQVELLINGTVIAQSTPFDLDGEVIPFVVEGIQVAGEFSLEIRNVTEKQVVLDNIRWTSYEGNGEPNPDPEPAPLTIVANPPAGAVPAGTTIQLTSANVEAVIHYTVDGEDPTEESPIYSSPITIEAPTIIKARAIAGDEVGEIYTFTYTIHEVPAQIQIHHLQGASHRSPYEGQVVEGIEGIVTYVNGTHGFYMQAPQADDDPRTSEGIYVYRKSHPAQVGDRVLVTGKVTEYRERGYDDAPDLTSTQIVGQTIQVIERGIALPEPVRIGEDGRIPPFYVVEAGAENLFDPERNALDFYESLEGMLIAAEGLTVVAPEKYQEVIVAFNDGRNHAYTEAGGVRLTTDDVNTQRLMIKWNTPVNVGDRLEGELRGVVGYDFSNYKIYPLNPMPQLIKADREQPVTSIEPADDLLTIATYNVENYAATSDLRKTRRLAQNIVGQLKAPDIIALVEVQDNDGPKDSGTTDASRTYEALMSAILVEGGPQYAFTDIAPLNKQDGGQPGGNIRVGYLYNPERVTLVDKPKGDATTAVTITEEGLSHNPGRIAPMHPAFQSSRKPLAAQFEFQGETVVVVANHFNSKQGDSPLFGSEQPLILRSEGKRVEIAQLVQQFVSDMAANMPDAHVVVLGDLNDFQFAPPLQVLTREHLTNVIDLLPAEQQYTYNYQGNSQVLDHILISNHLVETAVVEVIHLNSDFHESAGRASDHDPILVQLALTGDITPPPTVGKGQLELVGPRYLHPNQPFNVILTLKGAEEVTAGDLLTTWEEGVELLSIQPLGGTLQIQEGPRADHERRTLFFSATPLAGDVQLWQLKLRTTREFTGDSLLQVGGKLADLQGQAWQVTPVTYQLKAIHHDLNEDGQLTVGDLGIFANYYGKNSKSPDWEMAQRGDFNGDGRVDRADLQQLLNAIMESETTAVVPDVAS
ncbi:chitobiase/beta-hexosaminidase C-terminal domain-containing protein [Rubeoparvulum massiliense]|uniref:chitobiase/beta-hexosaminidase C-terminal domain-containing protein n=1 Tax=Rubeoparvulum massiliense TaxID=1631346 RepID=UPI00069FAD97|nr:chitobiase/beta-hexosaminidase C-terminal domain-containing protein [Rubeoparvulum massiliense]